MQRQRAPADLRDGATEMQGNQHTALGYAVEDNYDGVHENVASLGGFTWKIQRYRSKLYEFALRKEIVQVLQSKHRLHGESRTQEFHHNGAHGSRQRKLSTTLREHSRKSAAFAAKSTPSVTELSPRVSTYIHGSTHRRGIQVAQDCNALRQTASELVLESRRL